jgi:hypothetical protein
MPSPTSIALSLLLLAPLCAQQTDSQPTDPLQSLQNRLRKSIATMAALPSCAFDAHWGPNEDGPQNANGGIMLTLGGSDDAPGKVEGGWDAGDLAIHLEETGDDLRISGRRTLARQQGTAWQLRRGRFADGNDLGFMPDPQQLLQVIDSLKINVSRRAPDMLFDRPVEVLSVTLNQEQATALVHSGMLPPGFVERDFGALMARQMAAAMAGQNGGGAPARTAPPACTATFDLAFFYEPGTSVLHRIAIRSHSKSNNPFGAMGGNVAVAIQVGPGGQAVVQQDEGDDEDEASKDESKTTTKQGAELEYAAGLPVRPRKKMKVYDFVLDLHDHGAAKLPPLDDAQKALLGAK